MNEYDAVMQIEEGVETEQEIIDAYQKLIDSGLVWRLQGTYGRTAMTLIRAGKCRLGPTPTHDYYGNRIPSHDELMNGNVELRGFEYAEYWRNHE